MCCEDIGNECHYLITCKSKEISCLKNKFIAPLFYNWKGTNKISNKKICRTILSYQNDDITP